MLRFFNSSYLSRLVALILIAVVFWLPSILLQYSALKPDYFSPLFTLYLNLFDSYGFIHPYLSLLFVLATALIVNYIAAGFGFSIRTSYRAAFIYILFSAGLTDFTRMSPMIFINFMLALYTLWLMRLPAVKDAMVSAVNGGFIIGLMSLFYLPAMWLLVVQIIALMINRITRFKAYLATLISFLLPFVYLFTYYYLTGTLQENIEVILSQIFHLKVLFLFPGDAISNIILGAFLVMVVIGLFRAYSNLYRRKIARRRNTMTIIYMLLVLFFVILFCSKTYRPVMLLLVPGTLAVSDYLRYIKRVKLADVVFAVLFFLVLFNQYFQLYYAA